MGNDHRRELGAAGERIAGEHLIRRGFQIVERNFRTRFGELDIVAYDGRVLAFCEVKTRRLRGREARPLDGREARPLDGRDANPLDGPDADPLDGRDANPLEAIRGFKRAQVRRMAQVWLRERTERPYAQELRFDAIGVTLDASGRLLSLEHLEGAF